MQQSESTYFGSPKKLLTTDIVHEKSSSLSDVQTTNISTSIETGDNLDAKSDHPTQTLPEAHSTPQQHSNGLPVADAVPQPSKAHPRGILKNTKSEPVIVISEPIEAIKHSDSTGLIEISRPTWPKHGRRKFFNVSTSANYFRTTQEFVNPAFELDENIPSDSKLSDLVELVMKQQSDQNRYVHPFGQSNVFFNDTPTSIQNTETVVFWLIFVIMLVGLAGAIIIMAEMFRLDMLATKALNSTTVSS
ncbi:hypothetical protein KP79_PYT24005 [Mizuhopecten yessoensis]|uniref:Uncharacterized protein n=2 Tax=Mizuhopecten yessoensis TaxID=6573 RepID=A0A210PPZ0_MIZYE|nr:hypothetical protein KP79_PYT24005 [Mizuhopecten yessoensis]